jgi:predicted dehydrogenase
MSAKRDESLSKIRFGFVGMGRRGLNHIKVASQFKEVSLEAACDIDEGRLQEVASTYGIRVYKNLDEMLEKEKLDVTVVSTPTPLHVSQTLKCLESGLDVLLEKPISLDIREAGGLLKVVKESDRIVAVGFQLRYSSVVDKVKEAIDEDTLSMIAGYWYWTIPIVGWIRLRSQGGGQIVDQAIHLIDLARFFAGDVESVYAVYTEKGRNKEEDRAMGFDNWASYVVSLKFENGVVGCIYSTYALYPGIFKATGDRFVEDKATMESSVAMDVICREMLVRYIHPFEARIYRKDREYEVYRLLRDPTIDMYEAFIEALLTRDKKSLRTPYEDSYKTMAISLAANESAISGKCIHLPTFLSR